MPSYESPESKKLTPEEILKREQLRKTLAENSSPDAHHNSEEGHFRKLTLQAMSDKNQDEEEESHFRKLMERKNK